MSVTSASEVFDNLPGLFNSDAAKDLDAVFQFEIDGEGGGTWNVEVKDGACKVHQGSHNAPSVTLSMSSETLLAMANKEMNGMQAFMSGKLKVAGDILLAQKMAELFSL